MLCTGTQIQKSEKLSPNHEFVTVKHIQKRLYTNGATSKKQQFSLECVVRQRPATSPTFMIQYILSPTVNWTLSSSKKAAINETFRHSLSSTDYNHKKHCSPDSSPSRRLCSKPHSLQRQPNGHTFNTPFCPQHTHPTIKTFRSLHTHPPCSVRGAGWWHQAGEQRPSADT